MTQSTIREKIFRAVGIKALKEGFAEVKLDTALVVEIARLICEEMNQYRPDSEIGKILNNRAQEILKALE